MEKKNVRFGLVGTGTISKFHAQAISQVDDVSLDAVYSVPEEPAKAFAAEHGCEYKASLEALLASPIDAVAITTPSGTHAEIGIKAAEAGKHVLCEKPIDITLEKIDRLIEACDANNVHLASVFQSRTGEGARTLKKAVDEGRFGRHTQCSAYIPWYRSPEYYASGGWRGTWELDGGGALMNQGVHTIDLLLWFAGDVEEVSARCQKRVHQGIEVEDNASAWVRFAGGGLGVIQASTCSYPGLSRRIEIMGEKGTAVLEDDDIKTWIFDEDRPEDERIRNPEAKSGVGGGASDPTAISVEGHRRTYKDFAECILTGKSSMVSGREARRSVELILSIYRSDRENGIVKPGKG